MGIWIQGAVAMVMPGYLRLGPVRVPVYGVFAALGLVMALWLSQRTAKFVGIAAEKLWDAGMFLVVAAFVASRVLLILQDFRAFLQYPVLVLALPSLTYGGMALAGAGVWIYLWRKKLPVLDVMDAWAPCAALLTAVLSLGHFFEGTDAGMPATRVPWGVHVAGDTVLGKTHPVQLYAMVVALGMVEFQLIRLKRRKRSGEVAGLALVVGGFLSFGLDMLRQPFESVGSAWLDPSQWVAVGAICLGVGILWYRSLALKRDLTRAEVATILENFVEGTGGMWDWDEYITSEQFTDPFLAQIQGHCYVLSEEFPLEPGRGGWCNDQGLEVIREYARKLRAADDKTERTRVNQQASRSG